MEENKVLHFVPSGESEQETLENLQLCVCMFSTLVFPPLQEVWFLLLLLLHLLLLLLLRLLFTLWNAAAAAAAAHFFT